MQYRPDTVRPAQRLRGMKSSHVMLNASRRHFPGHLRNRRGATAIEYSVVIALALFVAVLGIEGLGLRTRHTLESTVNGLAGGSGKVAAASTPTRETTPHAPGSDQPTIITASTSFRYPGLLFASASILVGTAGGFITLRRRRRRPVQAAEVDKPEEIDQAAIFAKRHAILRILSDDVGILLDSRMDVKHLMSRKLSTIGPRATAGEVRQRMAKEKIRHLLVCEKSGKLVGVISDRDLRNRDASTASDLMTADPLSIAPDSPVSPAITLLIQRRISCLPVVDNERLVGVLTTTDLMMALQCALHALQKVAAEIADVHSQGDSPQPPECEATTASATPELVA